MDPASVTLAIGAASKAFSVLKRRFEVGRDIESMHGDIQKWIGASLFVILGVGGGLLYFFAMYLKGLQQ